MVAAIVALLAYRLLHRSGDPIVAHTDVSLRTALDPDELERARHDPKVRALHAEADAYLEAVEGRIAASR